MKAVRLPEKAWAEYKSRKRKVYTLEYRRKRCKKKVPRTRKKKVREMNSEELYLYRRELNDFLVWYEQTVGEQIKENHLKSIKCLLGVNRGSKQLTRAQKRYVRLILQEYVLHKKRKYGCDAKKFVPPPYKIAMIYTKIRDKSEKKLEELWKTKKLSLVG